ncbi:MAG TPA: UDP-N-acetylmuramoyl-tripeptide--D-alanyl-D-alanine ligase [Solirubrobacterales bacterium]|nr:UDP-N-acetylmuramoyl-tripeptide--D-alanyl-D-alanine ligase [Solirubrobacterales bacterium]
MIELGPDQIAEAIGADVLCEGAAGRPTRAAIDSRVVRPGDLFFGLRGSRVDGGEHAGAALSDGAWGAVVERARGESLAAAGATGWVFGVDDPLSALQSLARAWRRELGCAVVGITGSTGKTSVKDIVRALLPRRVHASRENMNTEIGLPLTILEAEPETEVLVLEMGMRGRGQIAELCAIAEPDVGAITNIGPVHLELLGTIEAVAATKAEILAGVGPTGRAVVPEGEEALAPHLDDALVTITFGPGGEVFARDWRRTPEGIHADVATPHGEAGFDFPFAERHNLTNALCAVAIGVALDLPVAEMARQAPGISFSRLRGELIPLPRDAVLINDCYNANPVSMQAALEHLGSLEVSGRRIAVLGGMAELGPEAPSYHREAGAQARAAGVDVLVGVGELARDYAPDAWTSDPAAAVAVVEELLGEGDAILVKGSRAVGLEAFTAELTARVGAQS